MFICPGCLAPILLQGIDKHAAICPKRKPTQSTVTSPQLIPPCPTSASTGPSYLEFLDKHDPNVCYICGARVPESASPQSWLALHFSLAHMESRQ